MIQHLKYSVSFPTNGITLAGEFNLQPGSTAVSGRNGKGKSFIAEMIRYGLFGKKALRGPASDYKTLDMTLSFEVNGTEYTVARAKKETLTAGEEKLAVGADAINKKIIEILGFGLDVFDVVCMANQKESERLTRLTPAKRKELIDDVVGLSNQEAVEKACKEEAKGYRREAEALQSTLVKPEKPTKPEGYRASEKIELDLQKTKEMIDKRARLQSVIDKVGEPPELLAPPTVSVEELEEHEQQRIEAEAEIRSLENERDRLPTSDITAEQIEQAEGLAEYDAEVKRLGPKPAYDAAELDGFERYWTLQRRFERGDEHQCPKCEHEWVEGMDEDELKELKGLDEPPASMNEIDAERRRIAAWGDVELVEPDGERLTRSQIDTARRALASVERRKEIDAELKGMKTMADRSQALKDARQKAADYAVFEREQERFEERLAAAEDAEKELAKLKEPKHDVEQLQEQLTEAKVYESQVETYDRDKARFDETAAKLAEAQERADGFTAGARGLVEARRELKAHLAPSLSRVASHLVSQMTVNAARPLYAVEIDEDMNIVVDGQDVSTFNGAHATIINLALRLALGQVLVSRVMPVFIGDEIDSDLDRDNAQAIADALLALTEQLEQVIIISHKRLENFDEEIEL